MDTFAGRRVWHDLDGVLASAIGQWADGGDLCIRAASRLVIAWLAAVRIVDNASIDIQAVVRRAAPGISPGYCYLHRGVWVRGGITCRQCHSQHKRIARLCRPEAFGSLL